LLAEDLDTLATEAGAGVIAVTKSTAKAVELAMEGREVDRFGHRSKLSGL
jgi:hypothetical protein